MIDRRHPYTGSLLVASISDIEDDYQSYRSYLDVECDITTRVDQRVVANTSYTYTHEVWMWGDAKVVFGGQEMTVFEYLDNPNRRKIEEGHYFRGLIHDKEVSGEIKFYNPSQQGLMLGIDVNDM